MCLSCAPLVCCDDTRTVFSACFLAAAVTYSDFPKHATYGGGVAPYILSSEHVCYGRCSTYSFLRLFI